mmetsp:Transcript_183018/g.580051  ORF Transcript_183018/g.580051 Transcript_183018/m.580051 type:complete len:305 (+) Transcript_183018:759-1673(+)
MEGQLKKVSVEALLLKYCSEFITAVLSWNHCCLPLQAADISKVQPARPSKLSIKLLRCCNKGLNLSSLRSTLAKHSATKRRRRRCRASDSRSPAASSKSWSHSGSRPFERGGARAPIAKHRIERSSRVLGDEMVSLSRHSNALTMLSRSAMLDSFSHRRIESWRARDPLLADAAAENSPGLLEDAESETGVKSPTLLSVTASPCKYIAAECCRVHDCPRTSLPRCTFDVLSFSTSATQGDIPALSGDGPPESRKGGGSPPRPGITAVSAHSGSATAGSSPLLPATCRGLWGNFMPTSWNVKVDH